MEENLIEDSPLLLLFLLSIKSFSLSESDFIRGGGGSRGRGSNTLDAEGKKGSRRGSRGERGVGRPISYSLSSFMTRPR